MNMSRSSTTVQIFISIRLVGASSQVGKILRFFDFFLVTKVGYCIFLFLGTRSGQTRVWIFTVCGSYDVFSPKDGPFGGCDNIGIYLGVISPKTP